MQPIIVNPKCLAGLLALAYACAGVSPRLTAGGVYGGSGPLKPTQRFWNLKQLGATEFVLPPASFTTLPGIQSPLRKSLFSRIKPDNNHLRFVGFPVLPLPQCRGVLDFNGSFVRHENNSTHD
jgi:hypothetical protein